MLSLPARYYRTVPMSAAGYVVEPIELEPARTALVAMHCWNIGCPDGPAVDDAFWVGMGFPETAAEAGRIMREVIRPCMDAARAAGILVCHVEAEQMALNRGEHRAEPAEPPAAAPDEAVPGWRQQLAWRCHGQGYPTRSPLASMDRAAVVAPWPDEPLVYTSEELCAALARADVEVLVYCGFATDMCVLRAPGGVEPMSAYGYRMALIRDATLGIEFPDTLVERLATRWAVRYFETHHGETIDAASWVHACRAVP